MKLNNETRIGIMVVIVLILLAWITINTSDFNFNLSKEGHRVKARFKDVDGVNLNSPVMYNGYEIGIVEDISIVYEGNDIIMELTLFLKDEARLRKDSKAYVKNLGFMGEKYIGLTSGNKDDPFLEPGGTIIGEEPPSFTELIKDGKQIAEKVKGITTNINERLETNKDNLDGIMSNTNTTMKNVSSFVGNLDERLESNEKRIDEILTNLNSLSKNLEELSYDLKQNPWKILYRSKTKKGKVIEQKSIESE